VQRCRTRAERLRNGFELERIRAHARA
jgi:hypothetical protein